MRAVAAGPLRASAPGRWGARRVRTTEVYASLTAEIAYDRLLQDAPGSLRAYARGELVWRVNSRTLDVGWQIRPNHIWKFGRLFLMCPACRQPVTRLYMPTCDAASCCRRCWNLTYECQQLYNYKDVGLLKEIGLTARNLAWLDTSRRRTASRLAARARAAGRRKLPWWRLATDRP